MSIWLEFCESSSKNVGDPDCGGQVFLDGHQAPIIKLKSKRGLKSPLEAKIQKNDPIGFFYEQKCPFDENLVYLAQKLSKPLFFMSSDFEIGVPFQGSRGVDPGSTQPDGHPNIPTFWR